MYISLIFSLLAIGWSGLYAGSDIETVEITEWSVPWANTRPRDPFVDENNRVWFVGQTGDYAAYLDPASGEFKRYDLDPGTGPHNLIVDPDGYVWYAGNRAAHIGRLDPKTGAIDKYPMPIPAARDPHTLIFNSSGEIWFTVQGGNFIGKFDPSDAEVILVAVTTPGSRPYGIVVDSTDRPWVALFGTNKIATVDPSSMDLKEFELPDASARPRRIAVTEDGFVWYVDYALGTLARLDPGSGQVEQWPAPAASSSRPYAMAADHLGRLWFVETGVRPNRLVGFDPETSEFFSVTEIASGAGSVRHMVFHPGERAIWFGTDANTIGRARIP